MAFGSGGTVTALAETDMRSGADEKTGSLIVLRRQRLKALLDLLMSRPAAARAQMISGDPKRADIIVAGGLVLYEIMSAIELDYLFAGDKTTVTAALYAESARYHEENPIYGRPADARGIGTSVIVLFPSWLPGKWSTGFRGAAWRDDSDIKFFDARFASLALVSARRW